MISCRKASELLSKSMDEPLTPQEALALQFHMKACVICEEFQRQLVGLRSGLRKLVSGSSPKDDSSLGKKRMPADMRAQLQSFIENKLSDDE